MTRTRNPGRRARRGFTLVEMLVVIVIIGILAAILIPAVYSSILSAKNAALKTELSNLSRAIEEYKTKYGDYPPDWTDQTVVIRHYKKIFPRSIDVIPTNLTEAQALVFCLQGYSPDVLRPFTGTGKQAVMDLDQGRLGPDPSGGPANYLVLRPKDLTAPYVYFDARTYANSNATYSVTGTITPYRMPDGTYIQPKTFQVLSAGLDDNYGNGGRPMFPTGVVPSSTDADNVANFNQGKTLQEDLP